jgi:VIT1/CCC1 family predicted Fe2+/Mn2+ transporter
MAVFRRPAENHLIGRTGWLRAAVLGANDGIISTASLIVGVAAAASSLPAILTAGLAGMIAGSMSMAAGEYVSVSSQSDTENADLAKERKELVDDPDFETKELAEIYTRRGIEPALARRVAEQLMAKDSLGAHARDELGISDLTTPKPVQAAFASAAAFAAGAALPIMTMLVVPQHILVPAVFATSLVFLSLLGALGAKAGGAAVLKPTLRVAFWGAVAMAITAGVGALVGKAV